MFSVRKVLVHYKTANRRTSSLDSNDKDISLKLLIPNLITILAFCSGLTSMRFALEQRWEAAVLAIMLAGVLDGMDGRVARLLGATSRFGALLDSLSDLVCFGVAPSFLVYSFSIGRYIKLGWSGVMFYTICMALRLARFNVMDEKTPQLNQFFIGVPAPAGALLVLTPLCLYLGTDHDIFCSLALNIIILWLVGVLLISRLPTICFKSVKIERSWLPCYLVGFALCAILFYNHLWLGLSSVSTLYLISIPYTYKQCHDQNR